MTEQEWLTSEDPAAMLRVVTPHISSTGHASPFGSTGLRPISDRKLRLWACAVVRQLWGGLLDSDKVRAVFAEAEPFHTAALGGVHPEYLSQDALTEYSQSVGRKRCIDNACRWLGAASAREVAGQAPAWLQMLVPLPAQAALLRCIAGNPWRPVTLPVEPVWSNVWGAGVHYPWLTPTVLSLAHAAYDERLPDGTLDPVRLAVLADALEEASCNNREILDHLRNNAVHVRGCWVLDLVLGKE